MEAGRKKMASGAVHHKWDDLNEDAPMPKLTRRRVVGKQAMISRVFLRSGCDIPTHSHANEQLVCVISGKTRFGVGAEGSQERQELILSAGEVLELPGNCPHSCYALEDTLILDIFSPPSQTTGIDRH